MQIAHQCLIKRHAGVDRDVIDPGAEAFLAVAGPERGDLFEVVGLDGVGVDLQPFVGLVVFQFEHPVEREEGLGLVEDVKDDDVVARVPEPVEGLVDRIGSRRANR